jgi:SAM-dependent methyltransferase
MIDYYAKRAQEYEQIYHKPERQDDLQFLRQFVDQTLTGHRVLEIACGTGYWTELLAGVADSVVATDINEEVLEIARTKSLPASKVRFARQDAYALPPRAENCSAGLGVFWWSHVPRIRLNRFLDGFHAALNDGAQVVFIDNLFVEGSSTPISRTDASGDTYQNRRLEDGSQHEVLKNFPTKSELRSAVAGSGVDIEVRFLRYYWILSYTLRQDKDKLKPE